MDSRVSSYISRAIVDILDSGFQIELVHDFSDGGFCDDTNKKIIVNTKGNIQRWFPTFVHEYCHFQQWKDNKFVGKKWDDMFAALYSWIDGEIELSKVNRISFSRRAAKVELDCEKRTVKEIEKHNLPINVGRYIQKANAYIFSYNFLEENQKEYYLNATWDNTKVINLMPKHFLTRYDRMPKGYRKMIYTIAKERECE